MGYQPLKMRPNYKDYLWGGDRLKTEFGKKDAPKIVAESWELSDHTDGISVIAEGNYAGLSLHQLGELDRDAFWGKNCRDNHFPILVKLIDAANNVSIQVHPSDETACKENGEQGKAEMWYIVDAKPQASIYYGFSKKIDKEEFLQRSKDGSIFEVLNRVPVYAGDVFFILPGTIHAIGAGIVVAEIQQNSNTTFRIYDYMRKDDSGKSRALNLQRAAEVIDYSPIVPSECHANSSLTMPEYTLSELFSCNYFTVYSIDVRKKVELCCDGQSFHSLLCVDGSGEIVHQNHRYPVHCGESFFLPAKLGNYHIEGSCRVLLSRV